MSNNQKRILNVLEANGGLTIKKLSENLGISATAIRRHLKVLEKDGLVSYRKEQRGIGRPCFVYHLKNGASERFPQSYVDFVESVLADLDKMGEDEDVCNLFHRRQRRRYESHIPPNNGKTLSERVACLAKLLEKDGRLTTWQRLNDGHYILRQHNCPLQELFASLESPCRCEVTLFEEILQTEVKRIDHIADGGVACVYEIADAKHNGHGQAQLQETTSHTAAVNA